MMQVGSNVVGKTKRTRGRIGIVLAVNTEGHQRKFEVEWSCGSREIVAARSITLAAAQETESDRGNCQNESSSTFTDLLLGVNDGVSGDVETSSSSEEAKQHREGSDEEE
ncbi:hypothetical protein DVH05_002936 [Phytophthora capsici]|nr:hypothetical protein DVH05_002936 [Phytophthora capsici]